MILTFEKIANEADAAVLAWEEEAQRARAAVAAGAGTGSGRSAEIRRAVALQRLREAYRGRTEAIIKRDRIRQLLSVAENDIGDASLPGTWQRSRAHMAAEEAATEMLQRSFIWRSYHETEDKSK